MLRAARVLFVQIVPCNVMAQYRNLNSAFRTAQMLADGDVFHLRGDDARASVLQLRDDFSGLGAERLTAWRNKTFKAIAGFILPFGGAAVR
jgi:hypothetical protein